MDLGGEREGGAGGHRVLKVAHSVPRVLLKLVGSPVVFGRSLSDFVFFILGEPHVEQGHVDSPVCRNDVLVAVSVVGDDRQVGGGAAQGVAGTGVGVGGGVGELGVVDDVDGHGVFLFLVGRCFLS